MISVPFAHVAGIPIEETLGTFGPALLLAAGVASAWLGAHIRHLRARKPRRGAATAQRPQSNELGTARPNESGSQHQ